MRPLPLAAGLAAFVLLTAAARQSPTSRPAQQPGLTFRSTANFVEIDAIVTDARGRIVRDLKDTDFEVIEDGRPQPLAVCSFIDIPIERREAAHATPTAASPQVPQADVPPDTVSNERPFDGRVFMIVLDSYHVATQQAVLVRKQAEKFVNEYLSENDLATVVHIGNASAGQEFTANRRLLTASIARFDAKALPSITASINADANWKNWAQGELERFGPARDTDAQVREFMVRESLDAIRRLSESMGALAGRRKALLLFSEGVGLDMTPDVIMAGSGMPPTGVSELRVAQRAMVGAAARSNVSIYSIDPRGLRSGMEEATLIGMTPAVPATEGAATTLVDYSNQRIAIDTQREMQRMKESLREYAEQTGGLAMVDKNDMDEAFDRIVTDNSSYYVLGYQSPDQHHDGRYHRISVKVKRDGHQVRTRQGYFAPSPVKAATKAPDPIVGILRSPAPVGGLGMRASAAVMKGHLNKSTVHLTIEFSGQTLAVKPEKQVLTNDITIEYVAVDTKGAIQANLREVVHLQLEPKYHATFPQQGVRYMHEFELASGRYQLRVAARDALGGKTGSVFLDVDVPDVAAPAFAMSDILLTSASAVNTATGKGTLAFGALLPTPPVTSRSFDASDTLTVLAAFYDNVQTPMHAVDLTATVRSESSAAVFSQTETRQSHECNTASGGYRWTVAVPLKGFAPGRYVLTLEGRSFQGNGEPVRRDLAFRVR